MIHFVEVLIWLDCKADRVIQGSILLLMFVKNYSVIIDTDSRSHGWGMGLVRVTQKVFKR